MFLYALAVAGGSASYAPFLTLILPLRASEIWGDQSYAVLSHCAFVGAIAASLSNIAFGWASDQTARRRGWIAAGLFLSTVLLLGMPYAETLPALLAMIFLWQMALNMMLGPMTAWAGDCVPDAQKGTLGGLLSLAPGGGALVGAFVTLPIVATTGEARVLIIAALVMLMVLPVLIFGNPRPMPQLLLAGDTDRGPIVSDIAKSAVPSVRRMWGARLLMQIAEAALFAFMLLWLQNVDGRATENHAATIFTFVLFTAVPIAFAAGRWSDRTNRPILPLAVSAGIAMIGLAIMALADDMVTGIGGYMLFGIMAAVFLALHASQTLRVLPRPQTRGRDLGFFNLTNTVPSLLMPWLALTLIPVFGFKMLFWVLSALAGTSCLLLLPLLRHRQTSLSA